MGWRLAATECIAGLVLPMLACSGSNDDDCRGGCEPLQVSGPHIMVTSGGPSIAAIETASPCVGGFAACGLSWASGPARSAFATGEPIVPAPAIDAGWTTGVCAQRFLCAPPLAGSLDSGAVCLQAWIDMGASNCVLTVVSTTGERQIFEAEGSCTSYRCRTGLGQCVTSGGCSSWPSSISVAFATTPPVDSGVVDAPLD